MLDKTYQPQAIEDAIYDAWEKAGAFAAGAPQRAAGASLRHRHPAAQRHRLAPYGARPQQHAAGHPRPLRAHARARRAVAARHRPCRHRHPDGGRAPIDGAPGAEPPRHGARGIHQARLAVEGRVGQHHRRPAEAARLLVRLVAAPLHHGRGPVARRAQGLRRALPRRPHLQGQAPRQLGPRSPDRHLRSRGRAGRDQGPSLASPLSDRGRQRRLYRRRHHAARDHARRHRRRRASRR